MMSSSFARPFKKRLETICDVILKSNRFKSVPLLPPPNICINSCRFCCSQRLLNNKTINLHNSTTPTEVRTRFAPSPTGIIHLGGLRTALYNYLFAKKHRGTFILRVEDTDQTRFHNESLKSIWEALQFAGVLPDEGPISGDSDEEVGHFGPYVQSKRLNIYSNYANKLLESGKAYRCFCSAHRLTMLKHAAYTNRTIPKYDAKCRHMSESETKERLSRKEAFTLRIKLPDSMEDCVDDTYGIIPGVVDEGHFIILKSDGFPTYHFANVVDDSLMRVTHVLRGAEWLSSLPRHLFLYQQLGFQPPTIHHLPLIASKSGQKLSKRDQSNVFVKNFIEAGYSPTALLNYIVQTGGGFELGREEDTESDQCRVMSLEEMCERFEIDLIRKNPAVLDERKLDMISRKYVNLQWATDEGQKAIVKELKGHLERLNLDEATIADDKLHQMLAPRICDVKNVKEMVTSAETKFLWTWEPPLETSFVRVSQQNKVIDFAIKQLERCEEPLSREKVEACLNVPISPFNISKVYLCIRLCLSIYKSGPRVVDMIVMLGKEETLRRLSLSVKTLREKRDEALKQATAAERAMGGGVAASQQQ